jgi:hypothetical protein
MSTALGEHASENSPHETTSAGSVTASIRKAPARTSLLGERSPHSRSWFTPYVVRRSLADAAKPDLCRGAASAESRDGGVVVGIQLIVARFNIDGDELAVVFGSKRGPYDTVEDLISASHDFLWAMLRAYRWHDYLPLHPS